MRCLPIPIEGPCVPSSEEPSPLAKRLLGTDMLSVCVARALGTEPRVYVIYIDDWGAVPYGDRPEPLPINRRAWGLYGGSPIHGLAVVAADDQGPLDPELIDLVNGDFPTPEMHAAMDRWLEANR